MKKKDLGYKKSNSGLSEDDGFQGPRIKREPSSKQAHIGDRITISVVATGNPNPSYQWYLNGKKISGAITNRFIIAKARRSHTGIYSCEVKNIIGSVMSRGASISFFVKKFEELVISPASLTLKPGAPLDLKVVSPVASELRGITVYWTFNGKKIKEARGLSLSLSQVKKKYEGEYKAVAIVENKFYPSNPCQLSIAGELTPEAEIPKAVEAEVRPLDQPEASQAGCNANEEDSPVIPVKRDEFFFSPDDLDDFEESPNELDLPFQSSDKPARKLALEKKRAVLEKLLASFSNSRLKNVQERKRKKVIFLQNLLQSFEKLKTEKKAA